MARTQMLVEWLDRTSQLPLYIYVFLLQPQFGETFTQLEYDTPAWTSINSIVDKLNDYTGRMRVLNLSLPGLHISRFGHNESIPSLTATTTNSILEKLSIDVCPEYFPVSDFSGFQLGGQMPSPAYVSFRLVDHGKIDIQWENVTVLEVDGVGVWEVLGILQRTPRIQQLEFVVIGDEEDLDSYEQVTPLFLKSLAITQVDTTWTFLNFLTCPALENFSCVLTSETSTIIIDLFKRSECILETLTLEVWKTYFLVPVLRVVPSLTHLTLLECGIPDEFLKYFEETACTEQKRLAGDSQDGLFLPNLCSFSCTALSHPFLWSNIPSMIPQSPVTGTTMVHRPLSEIEVLVTWDVARRIRVSSAVEQHVIDLVSLMRIMELVRDGVSIEIWDQEHLDLISFSQKHYGLNS